MKWKKWKFKTQTTITKTVEKLVMLSKEEDPTWVRNVLSDKSYNMEMSFSFSHLERWRRILLSRLAPIDFSEKEIRTTREWESVLNEGARFDATCPFFRPRENNPTREENAIIKTSNEFYVCECGVSATIVSPKPNFRSSPGFLCCMVSVFFFGRLVVPWSFRKGPVAPSPPKLANQSKEKLDTQFPPTKNMYNKVYKMHCFFCIGCCCRKIIR